MKRFYMGLLIGLIVGAVAVISSTAAAQTVINNMIGKTIDGQYPVSISGETLTNPAIVVDGTSYLPVRQFGQKAGYIVTFDPEGEITLEPDLSKIAIIHGKSTESKKWEDDMNAKNKLEADKMNVIINLGNDIKKKNNEIKLAEERIKTTKDRADTHPPLVTTGADVPYKESSQYQKDLESIAKDEAEINRLKAEIAVLEAEKAALEAQQ